ncbi:MAG: methylmalonyl-CoA mutase [Myxococcales bacterium]|nr:methylmalonyl-CoA mutase [Myxococcales bacterium]
MTAPPKEAGPRPVVLESGVEVKASYGSEEVARACAALPPLPRDAGEDAIGRPGEYPFTRGIHPLMYRKQPWTMRQYAGFGTAAETNARFKYLIAQGQTGLNVAFDLPTQCGLDSDDPRAAAEVGRVGMAVDTVLDLEEAFAGIDLQKVTVSLTINAVAPILLAMVASIAKRRGIDPKRLRGTLQNDILKEFIGRGTWIFPVDPSIKLIGDTVEFCAREMPLYSPVSVCGYHIRESGATPVQEMACAFLIARAYTDHALSRGLGIDEFASRLSFNFDIYGNLFEQVAKFRAGRRLWARIMREEYGAKDPRSCWMRMIAGGGGGGLTVEQPELNIVRGAYYALISALSGTQTMALCSYDEAFTIPSERAARISLRTMQILVEEMGLCDTVDPLGGSWYVETLTHQLEAEIRRAMEEIQKEGGIVAGVKDGRIQARVARQAYQRQRDLESGKLRKVGVNCYRGQGDEAEIAFHPFDPAQAQAQAQRLAEVRRRRDSDAARRALERVREAAAGGANTVPPLIEAVEAHATLGEMVGALREVYGGYVEPVRFA